MGQEASAPRPGTDLQVIGACLPSTGNITLSLALEILLRGPVYHGATQVCKGPAENMDSWIAVFKRCPVRDERDAQFIRDTIGHVLRGYAATTDGPGSCFVPELAALHPRAKVICTVTDADAWARAQDRLAAQSFAWYLRVLLLPLPNVRRLPEYFDALSRGRWAEMYQAPGEAGLPSSRRIWDKHMENLRAAVPEDRLAFYDVRDGWGPLCDALGCEVPDVPFPEVVDDSAAIEGFAKSVVFQGMVRWGVILGVGVAVMGFWLR
ncbi:uncharacterized protein E0L32_010998 [Thyridium curvatum]|uniref:NAD dependent epimerase/dehydratase n=1 Tax=Thyridium curvatum TaxID=1093900 RepID=A0A507AIR6_9PEZI|nr:uncharacterized protein E0L32_010998 [Thyridium curvatum]TPX07103.1 hypothetical protein E0L32_010998 [Thyridium curvatum]